VDGSGERDGRGAAGKFNTCDTLVHVRRNPFPEPGRLCSVATMHEAATRSTRRFDSHIVAATHVSSPLRFAQWWLGVALVEIRVARGCVKESGWHRMVGKRGTLQSRRPCLWSPQPWRVPGLESLQGASLTRQVGEMAARFASRLMDCVPTLSPIINRKARVTPSRRAGIADCRAKPTVLPSAIGASCLTNVRSGVKGARDNRRAPGIGSLDVT
jgi:hypothetical protein